ncbi:hypothetical protein ACFX1T_032608 [Malus domestica]
MEFTSSIPWRIIGVHARISQDTSANDLYDLPKASQEALNLAHTCPNGEQIIQKTTNPAMKARFQHIRKARVLGFEVDPYTDIETAELPFSFEDL